MLLHDRSGNFSRDRSFKGALHGETTIYLNEYTGIVIDAEQTNDIVGALGDKRALILANHGLLTCAATVEQAVIDMIDMERTCRVNMDAMATGRPVHSATYLPAWLRGYGAQGTMRCDR